MELDTEAIRRIVRRVLLSSAIPLVAACGPIYGEATYVLPKVADADCHEVCATLKGRHIAEYTTIGDVMSCIDGRPGEALLIDAGMSMPPSDDLAICRMRTINTGGGAGRVPAGLAAPRACNAIDEGALLAEMAHLEAASVKAFRRLASELRAHGAPDLALAARNAARDEIRHARIVSRWRDRHGGAPLEVQISEQPTRSLAAIAQENALEGCVHETWGAIVAAEQAQHAEDEELRHDFAAIAIDEASHAALAWQVDAWARARLDPIEMERIDRARARAAALLFNRVDAQLARAGDAGRSLGLPSRERAARMIEAAHTELPWAA